MTPQLDPVFAALSDRTRRGVIDLLRRQPRRASDLADALGASRPAMSRHLRVLRASGLVETEATGELPVDADARERVYRLRPDPFVELRAWLDQVEQFWSLQLTSFKEHVERTHGKRRPR